MRVTMTSQGLVTAWAHYFAVEHMVCHSDIHSGLLSKLSITVYIHLALCWFPFVSVPF